jgi:Xaa-Pro aminopeptidase
MYFPPDECHERWTRTYASLAAAGLRRKSPRELECFREGGAIVSAALGRQLETAVRGGAQAEIAAAGAAEVIRRGGGIHMIPVASGTRGALAPFTNSPLTGYDPAIVARPGDLVRTWIYGPIWQGYWLDPGRTVVVGGRPNGAQRKLITAANEVVTRLVHEIQPGLSIRDLARRGRELREAAGTVEDPTSRTFPLLGHGNGLFGEAPTIWLDVEENADSEPLFEGQVLGIETILSDPEVGSAGVEQNLIVHAGGNELLTTTPLEWW